MTGTIALHALPIADAAAPSAIRSTRTTRGTAIAP